VSPNTPLPSGTDGGRAGGRISPQVMHAKCAVATDNGAFMALCKLGDNMYLEIYRNGRGNEVAKLYSRMPYKGVEFNVNVKMAICRDGDLLAIATELSKRAYVALEDSETLDFLPPPDEDFEEIIREEYYDRGVDVEKLIQLARACYEAVQ